jgi:hypothetical protein
MRLRSLLAVVGVVLAAASSIPSATASAFPTSGVPDYQLGGAYTPAADVTIVERDSTSHPVAGRYNICYVNGFQTQSEDARSWRAHHRRLLLRAASGAIRRDPGWPGEMLLDTSTASRRRGIAAVIGRSIDRCASRGFDAVEFDNLDSWTRSKGSLTRADNLALATLLVARAHHDGLLAGQKNTPQLGAAGRDRAGFDFAVAEECVRYSECRAYTRVYGARVIDIEYTDDQPGSWASICASAARPAMTILRDRELVPPGRAAYTFRHC